MEHVPASLAGENTRLFQISRFNLSKPDRAFLFNTMTGAGLVPTERQRDILASIAQRRPVPECADTERLYEGGFVLDAGVREVETLKASWFRAITGDKAPMLTIAPTMNCNFGCDYCFECHEAGLMKPAVRDALVDFIRTELAAGGPVPLSVTWFGGEPLMGVPVILDLSDRFDALVSDGVLTGWSAFMITNGLLATPKTMRRLSGRNISNLQVTIDGPRDIHDQRRVLKRGRKPTFDIICRNLRDLPDEFGLSIRINVDRRNAGELETLAEQLAAEGILDRPKTGIYLAIVENYDGPLNPEPEVFLTSREFSAVQSEFAAFCAARGYPYTSDTPSPTHTGVCQVDNVNAFVVDPDGSLMKCWAELRNRPQIVANLLDRDSWPEPELSTYELRDPFDDEECCACPLLPACMGSCPKIRETNRAIGIKSCPPMKHDIGGMVASMSAAMSVEAGTLQYFSTPKLLREAK